MFFLVKRDETIKEKGKCFQMEAKFCRVRFSFVRKVEDCSNMEIYR